MAVRIQHKRYSTPRRLFEKARIEEENLLLKNYGLKNKREVWKADFAVSKLRNIAKKFITASPEEQKKFIDMKYPKSGKFKFHWKMITSVLFYIVVFAIFMRMYYFIIYLAKIDFAIWSALLFVMVMPIIINMILAKFNLQQKGGDLLFFFKKY